MTYPLVTDLAADGIPVAVTCRVLGFSTQGYYAWKRNPISDRDWRRAHLINAALDVHADDPEFGYRFIADELQDAGLEVCRNTVHALCKEAGITSITHRRSRSGRRPGPPVHDDLVRREFNASKPNQLWLTDITEHPTNEGKLYLCAFKDVWNNEIVGYSIANRMKTALAVNALNNALARQNIKPNNKSVLIIHSDRGSQFRSRRFCRVLKDNQIIGSMGRVGAAGDNAAMESFFALLQKNVLNRKKWQTQTELRSAIVNWIEGTYHRRRRQDRLGGMTPIEFKTVYAPRTPASSPKNPQPES